MTELDILRHASPLSFALEVHGAPMFDARSEAGIRLYDVRVVVLNLPDDEIDDLDDALDGLSPEYIANDGWAQIGDGDRPIAIWRGWSREPRPPPISPSVTSSIATSSRCSCPMQRSLGSLRRNAVPLVAHLGRRPSW